ncbi:hypothetical protein [Streptomyces sp. NRRL F-5123]|uniref:hypothetical protein n=1 Tax=Streptomyces sp. NRRL F-5123 TaxID=1463856 RepID=UPI000B322038|nr:hypothetical protein [Streptomyces sp. NRRL F-5123]
MSGNQREGSGGLAPEEAHGMEERLRPALADAAGTIAPGPWPAGRVRGRAARRRRNRRIAVCLPALGAAAAVAVAAVLAGATRGQDGPGPAAPAPPTHPAAPPSPRVVWPAVRVVAPGKAFGIGDGDRMRVTAGERCVDGDDGASWDCRDETNADGNQPPESVNVQSYGYAGGMRYLLVYRGTHMPARMGVTFGGRVRPATVVTLAVHPGWVGGYLDVPSAAAAQDPYDTPGVTVWDAAGRVIASMPEVSAGPDR